MLVFAPFELEMVYYNTWISFCTSSQSVFSIFFIEFGWFALEHETVKGNQAMANSTIIVDNM